MQTLLSRKSISMTELREPAKVIAQAGNCPVAILNRSQVVGYFVPVAAISPAPLVTAGADELGAVLARRRTAIAATLKYLEDK
ncbi:prevent-host-death family protein [Thiothrix litoralis]|jgi:antitoxin StbD|uniref:Prevent-host-death family protein n=1 Tax=Thiothrix litoralis TaxID=2891210 RepID=A0ABX7X314_9GAMM|nr:prevent-host-death family protein [Thiothrix litoralis]QTR47505.1 prevent-host-death family protein [Thiothrix litoralis]